MNRWTVSLYLSEPKADFTPNCESVAVEEAEGPTVADQWSLKMPPTVLINSDRMQDTFERFLPEPQKGPQLREIWVEVVVLPDVALQQPGMVGAPIQDIRRG
jgi:hypothetical protein